MRKENNLEQKNPHRPVSDKVRKLSIFNKLEYEKIKCYNIHVTNRLR